MEGYETFTQEFYINPGQMININMKMTIGTGVMKESPKAEEPEKEHGVISLDLEPVSAEVFVDGKLVGTGEDLKNREGSLRFPLAGTNLNSKRADTRLRLLRLR